MVAGRQPTDASCAVDDLQLARFDEIELVPLVSLADDIGARRNLIRLQSACHALESDHAEWREKWALLQERQPLRRNHADGIQPAQVAPRDGDEHRQQSARQEEARAWSDR